MTTLTIEAQSLPPDELGWLVAIVVAIMMVFISMRRRKEHQERPPTEVARDYVRKLHDEDRVKGDMEALLVEIQEMARQISGQLDTRFAKLEVLIRDADERIARLERLTARAGRPMLDATVDDEGIRATVSGNGRDEAGANDDHRRIYSLADAGKSAVEIAQTTGHNTGEIELILALRQRPTD